MDPRLSLAPSGEQLEVVWEYLNDFLAPCLKAQSVSILDTPSREAFVSSGGRGWLYLTESPGVAECIAQVPAAVLIGEVD